MNNIRQITDRDLIYNDTVTKNIYIEGDDSLRETTYKIIPAEVPSESSQASLGSSKVFKLGYCVDSGPGINYPIFLRINAETDYRTFYVGKTGMFEFQPEEWVDVNDDNILRTATVYVSGILVPAEFGFVLDYVYSVS